MRDKRQLPRTIKEQEEKEVASYSDQVRQRTIALDPRFADTFVHSNMVCKCGGDIMKGGLSSGFAVNYRECIKCGKNFFRRDKVWDDLLEERARRGFVVKR